MKLNKKGLFALVVRTSTIAAGIIGVLGYLENRNQNKDHYAVNLTGEWIITNTIESTSYRPFKDLQLGYRIFFQQNGKRIIGKGEKCWENEKELPSHAHSPVSIDGILDELILTATFEEKGSRRITYGSFVWNISPDGKKIEGRFTHTAANSKGNSVGILVRHNEK